MKRALCLLAAAAVLSGCSAVRLAYDNADTYLRWRAGSYLDVQGAAGDELDDRIDAFLDWHRAKALPLYSRYTDEAAKRLGAGLSPDDLVWGYDTLMGQAKESLRSAAVQIAPMLDRMNAEQIVYLEKRFEEDNRKFAREYLKGSDAERRQRRAGQLQERLEEWVGKLTPPQVERVRRYSQTAPVTAQFRDRDRKRLQADVIAMVRKREAQKYLPDLAAAWQEGRDPDFTVLNEAWRKDLYALILDLDRMLSPAQRARAVAHFRRYSEDFSNLASRVP